MGTEVHGDLQKSKARPLLEALHAWLFYQRGRRPPKGPMGRSITYALAVWPNRLVYFAHPKLRPDCNFAERALRAVAPVRKDFMFVGNDAAGEDLAVLRTLLASCGAHNVNPQAFFADVLIRIQTHQSQPDTRPFAGSMQADVQRLTPSTIRYPTSQRRTTCGLAGAYDGTNNYLYSRTALPRPWFWWLHEIQHDTL